MIRRIRRADEVVSLSLYERLRMAELRKGIIHFRGIIENTECEDFQLELASILSNLNNLPEITMRMTSSGGDAYNAFAMYSVLKYVSRKGIKVKIIVEGLAASAAAMIVLQAADERLAYEESSFLLHEPKRWVFFSAETKSNLEDEMFQLRRITDRIIKILSERCNKKEKEVRELIERHEVWMTADEALKWGLIDGIIDRV